MCDGIKDVFTHSNSSHVGRAISGVYASVRLSVCLSMCRFVFPHVISKFNAARITKLDIDMVHHESCNSFILGSKVKVTRHKNSAGVGLFTPVSAGCL